MSKKKLVSLCLVLALVLTAVVGGTMAYFTDEDAQTNTFTSGNVYINLDEEEISDTPNEDGDLVGTGNRTDDNQEYELFPGMTVDKDPTITNTGTEDAYVAAIVTVTGNIHDLIGVPGYDNIDITQLASGGLVENPSTQVTGWNGLSMVYETVDCVIYQDATGADNNTWVLYVFVKDALANGDNVVLFENLTIPAEWDNDEMKKINNMVIDVKAYAVQANGFAACYDAMVAAFGDGAFAAVK